MLAARLDLGVADRVAGPRHTYDIRERDVRRLLISTATHVAGRDLDARVQVPGRSLPLRPDTIPVATKAIGGKRPRFRILVTGGGGSIVENIAVEVWTESTRALRSRSDDPAIRLLLPGHVGGTREALPTDVSITFPIDAVLTWVDASDPGWRALAAHHMDLGAIDPDRYAQSGELRYALRSLDVFAPWVHRIHVLSNCSPPTWFRPSERVRWVDHGEVMSEEQRPQFNSGAIDTYLHRIPDLSEHFLYLNDDFVLWDSALPSRFFTWDGRSIAHLAVESSVIYLQQLVDAGRATPSQHSRINAARLLQARVGVYPTRLHGHVPYALRRSVMERIESEFADEIAATRTSRMREPSDVSFVALLYHYFADAHGLGVLRDAPHSLVTRNNYRRKRMLRSLRSTPFVCIQDSRGSATEPDYQAFKRETLQAALPVPSSAEHTPAGSSNAVPTPASGAP